MEIFGFENIDTPRFVSIKSIEEIENTTPKDIVLLDKISKPYTLIRYCIANSVPFAVIARSIKDAVVANHLGASFIIIEDLDLAREVQEIANEYLWDSKVIVTISKEEEIERVAKAFIDGAIIKKHIKGL